MNFQLFDVILIRAGGEAIVERGGGGIVALAIAPVIATKMNFIEQRDV